MDSDVRIKVLKIYTIRSFKYKWNSIDRGLGKLLHHILPCFDKRFKCYSFCLLLLREMSGTTRR